MANFIWEWLVINTYIIKNFTDDGNMWFIFILSIFIMMLSLEYNLLLLWKK